MNADDAITLRTARPSDRAFLLGLYASTRAGEFAQLGWSEQTERAFMTLQFDAQRAHYERSHAATPCQVIEQRGCAVGRLWVAQSARSLSLLDVSLLADRRGQGIGSACLRRVLRQAEAAGLDVELQVLHGNPARRLYERLGWRVVGEDSVRVAMAWKPPQTAAAAQDLDFPQEMHHEQA